MNLSHVTAAALAAGLLAAAPAFAADSDAAKQPAQSYSHESPTKQPAQSYSHESPTKQPAQSYSHEAPMKQPAQSYAHEAPLKQPAQSYSHGDRPVDNGLTKQQ